MKELQTTYNTGIEFLKCATINHQRDLQEFQLH